MSRGVVIVLAAGRGRRMGGPKALMPVRERAWWEWQAGRLRACGRESVWVVSGEVERGMRGGPLSMGSGFGEAAGTAVPRNDGVVERMVVADSDGPMMASVLAGLRAVGAQPPETIFVLPVDVPCAGREVLDALESAAALPGVAVPRYRGVNGHPVALSWGWVERKLAGAGGGARLDELIDGEGRVVEVEEPSVAVNLNTPEDVRAFETRMEPDR